MRSILRRLGRPTLLQAVAEILGLGCICLAAFMVASPLGFLALGLSLLVLGNVRLERQ